jgi:ribosomal protein L37E
MDDYSAPQQEKRAAKSRHGQAVDQLELLQRGTKSQSSDFYTYRYLATEGFLPGYNFPRLPLMAYVPATTDGRGRQTYLQRPRFLALSEFGPRSLVYHEGRAFRVVRAMLPLSEGTSAQANLPTLAVRICKRCGAGHFTDHDSLCHGCGSGLGDAEIVKDVYRIENVATQATDRITANDEERQRQGFELQTTFEWATRGHVRDVRSGACMEGDDELLRLSYGAGATITRLNKGLRRRADRAEYGFKIDPVTGYWAKNDEEDEDKKEDPEVAPRQRIVPSVQDRKNALLIQPWDATLEQRSLATLQHALLRGIESVFQLEEGEVLAEPMPTRDERGGFLLYEATEGGAGVLTRLVSEDYSLATVAKEALRIMHFELGEEDRPLTEEAEALRDLPGTSCVAACYRCLMSYFNQPDHELLDRRDVDARALLLRLARATTHVRPSLVPPAPGQVILPIGPPGDTPLARWKLEALRRQLPEPDAKPYGDGEVQVPLVWREHYVAAFLGAPPAPLATKLEEVQGFVVISFQDDEAAWPEAFARLEAALGRSE